MRKTDKKKPATKKQLRDAGKTVPHAPKVRRVRTKLPKGITLEMAERMKQFRVSHRMTFTGAGMKEPLVLQVMVAEAKDPAWKAAYEAADWMVAKPTVLYREPTETDPGEINLLVPYAQLPLDKDQVFRGQITLESLAN